MKLAIPLCLALLSPLPMLCSDQSSSPTVNKTNAEPAVCPQVDCVPDEKTAVRIALAVLIPIFGEKHIRSEEPFTARLKDNRWIVKGSLPRPKRAGEIVVGGTAMVEIDKLDGRIIAVYHLK